MPTDALSTATLDDLHAMARVCIDTSAASMHLVGWGYDALAELVRRAEEAATLRTERDRLARILAVERGDEGAAPSGWKQVAANRDGAEWRCSSPRGLVVRADGRWRFMVHIDPMQGDFDNPLEAMEAADLARGAHHD